MNKIHVWKCAFVLSGDKELVQEVLFDAVVTAPLEAYWTSLVLNKSEYVPLFKIKGNRNCYLYWILFLFEIENAIIWSTYLHS